MIEIELRDSLHDKPKKLHLLEQSVLITTESTTMYELQFAQRLSNPIKHKGDQIIIQSLTIKGHGVLCLSEQGHLFLF